MKILLLEDDELFASSLCDYLEEEGFVVDHALDGEELLDFNFSCNYDLYLLDINVPKIDGLELLKNLRQSGDNTPAIYLTSYKDKETLKSGFLSGADDYMTKPVELEELILRINALLKRYGKDFETINIGNIIFNPKTKEIQKDGNFMQLPLKVIDLFELFCQNRGQVVSKDLIISTLWSVDEEFSEGSIRVYITKIKQLFEHNEDCIKNIKGVGYKVNF